MPRKQPKVRRTIETEIIDDEEREHAPPIEYVEEDSEAVRQMMSELGAGETVKIKVSRLTKDGPQYCFISDEPIQDLEETLAKDPRFPDGGKFQVKIYVNGLLRLTKTLNIAPRYGGFGAMPNGLPGGMYPPMYGGGQDAVIRLLESQLTELRAELRSMRTTAPPASSALELAQAVSALKQIESGSGSTATDTLKIAMELAKLINGQGETDWKSELLGAAKEILPVVLKGNNAGAPAPANGNLASGAIAEGGVMQQQNSPANPPAVNDDLIKLGIAELKQKCRQGASPDFYVEALVTYNDREPYASIYNRIVTSEFESFATLDTEINSPIYKPFFRAIFDGLREYSQSISTDGPRPDTEESNTVEGDRGRANGDARNDKPHVKTGKGSERRV
jgi:hypothetical protein